MVIELTRCIYSRINRPTYNPTSILAAENLAEIRDSHMSR